jgi:hypothetical protein
MSKSITLNELPQHAELNEFSFRMTDHIWYKGLKEQKYKLEIFFKLHMQ